MKAPVLAINPSSQTKIEAAFWQSLSASCIADGRDLIRFTAIEIRRADAATTERVPRALIGMMSEVEPVEAERGERLPPWMNQAMLRRHVDWEYRRWGMATFDPRVVLGAIRLAWRIEDQVRKARPLIVLTTNKIDHPCAFGRAAAKYHGFQTALIERSPIETIIFEPDGLFTQSEIWDLAPRGPKLKVDLTLRASMAANPAGYRSDEASDERPAFDDLPRPIVFLPFDNVLWTGWMHKDEPSWALDNPIFDHPQDAIDRVADWTASQGGSLVVKAHPSCRETGQLNLPANTRLVNTAIDHAINAADLIVTFNTKIAFIALAMGRSCVTLANNPIAASGLTVHHRDHADVTATLDAALALGPKMLNVDRYDSFLTWLAEKVFYTASRDGNRGTDALLQRISKERPGRTDRRVADPDDSPLPRRRVPHLPAASTGRIFVDVSRLIDHRAVHTGIARYGRELIRHLPSASSREVWAVVQEPDPGWDMACVIPTIELLELIDGRLITLRAGDSIAGALKTVPPMTDRDVYHSIHLPLPPPDATGAAVRLLTVHDVLHLRRPDLYPRAGTPTIRRSIDSLTANDMVLCDSWQTRNDLLMITSHLGDQTFTVPLGCDIPPQIAPAAQRHDITCFIQPEPRKNSWAVLTALAQALTDHRRGGGPHSIGHIFTRSSQVDMAHITLRAAGLDPSLFNVVADAEDGVIGEALARSRAFLWGSEYEGFGLPVLEAMAHGVVPVLAPNSSHIDVAGDSGAYAPSTDSTSLAKALHRVLADSEYAQRLSNRAVRRARLLSWRNTAKMTVAAYNEARRIAAT